ncbi:MAG: hypothetical protein IPH39_01015 [Sulfuritalea sp.]|jgi:hemerythrin|nr:hypothetical protein [Sulfuritalea sp.]MBK8760203.1 hypothetical protein [Sulfuritalea sp.]MBK9352177.1 hypothetical protein [Sulfuritalea sp.]MBP7422854.1 hypothetical protein [Sulfuritalea sp.]
MTALNPSLPGVAPVSPAVRERDSLRRELVDAQVHVLNMYLDKRSPDDLAVALDRLIQCCRASFEAEEALMARLRSQADPVHRDRHQAVLERLEQLRLSLLDTDRGRLLANLILIDRELISHAADARTVEASEGRAAPASRGPVSPIQPEQQH